MRYLSLDTEATGLEVDSHLIQIAIVPVDGKARVIREDLGRETAIWCPSFEELKPKLNPWVLEHNETLIRDAHAKGIKPEAFGPWLDAYLSLPEVKTFFEGERPTLMGKSMSALDIPILTRYLGKPFMEKAFHHHTLDITCVARFLIDLGVLPRGMHSTTKLLQYFQIRHKSNHTALSDAVDMGHVYFKLLELLDQKLKPKEL